MFFGLDFTDTFYHLNQALYAGNISVLSPLTSSCIVLLSNIFNNQIIFIRLFNWLVIYAAYILFYLIMRHENVVSKKSFWLLSGSVMLIPFASLNVFNGNNLTAFFLLMAFVSLYTFTSNGKQCGLLGLLITIGLGILSRFPNVVIIPIISILAWTVCKCHTDYLKVLVSLALSFLLYLILCFAIFGSASNYLSILQDSLDSTQNSVGANHSIKFLMSEYLHTLKDIVSNIKYISVLFLLPLLSIFYKKRMYLIVLSAIFLISQITFIKLRVSDLFIVKDDFLAYCP